MLHAIAVMIATWFACIILKAFVVGLIEDVPKLRWLYIMLEHGVGFLNIIFVLGSLATLWLAIGTLGSFIDGYIGAGFGLLVLTIVLALVTFFCAIGSYAKGQVDIEDTIKLMKEPMKIAGNVRNKDELYELEHYALNEIYVVNGINTPYICADDDEWKELDKDIFERIKAGEQITRADIEGVDMSQLNKDGTPKVDKPHEIDEALWSDPRFKGMLKTLNDIKAVSDPAKGSLMYAMESNKVYRFNGQVWVEYKKYYK